MAEIAKPVTDAGAEKAYAEAAAKVEPIKPVAASSVTVAPTAGVAPAQSAKAAPAKAEAPKVEQAAKPVAAPVVAKAAPIPAAPKPAPVKAAPAKAVVAKPIKTKTVPSPKPAAHLPAPTKDTKTMATTTTEITTKIQDAVKDAAAKAKTFAEKGQAGLGEVSEFAKGNVEAMVASTKILASGMQEMGKGYATEAKTAFETMTADAKDLASAKSPTEFFEKQTAILKKNFDAAVAKSSKSSEAMLKLANEAFQPLSTRMSLAMEKVKKAA